MSGGGFPTLLEFGPLYSLMTPAHVEQVDSIGIKNLIAVAAIVAAIFICILTVILMRSSGAMRRKNALFGKLYMLVRTSSNNPVADLDAKVASERQGARKAPDSRLEFDFGSLN